MLKRGIAIAAYSGNENPSASHACCSWGSEINYRIVNLIVPLQSDGQEYKVLLNTAVLYLSLKWGRIYGFHTGFLHFLLLTLISTAFSSWAVNGSVAVKAVWAWKEGAEAARKGIRQIPLLCCQMLLIEESQWQPPWRIMPLLTPFAEGWGNKHLPAAACSAQEGACSGLTRAFGHFRSSCFLPYPDWSLTPANAAVGSIQPIHIVALQTPQKHRREQW